MVDDGARRWRSPTRQISSANGSFAGTRSHAGSIAVELRSSRPARAARRARARRDGGRGGRGALVDDLDREEHSPAEAAAVGGELELAPARLVERRPARRAARDVGARGAVAARELGDGRAGRASVVARPSVGTETSSSVSSPSSSSGAAT